MALSAPRLFFGVSNFVPYSRVDGTFYGEMRVLKSSSLSLASQQVELMGGSSKYAWGVEEGGIQAELSLKFSEYPDFAFTLFLGMAPTSSSSAESSGNVSTLTNFYGSSVVNATTGIATATSLTASIANLKFGKYTVVAVSSSTVDIYLSSDIDMGRGTNGSYTTDGLKISAAQSITSGAATDFATYGFKLTGGSGTIGMTTGDTATFYVRPVNAGGYMTVRIGGALDQVFPEFGCMIYGQKRGTGEMIECEIFRAKASGFPINFEANAWSESEVKIKMLYDNSKDALFDLRFVKILS